MRRRIKQKNSKRNHNNSKDCVMRKLLWNFSVIWTNCILACVKKDIIDAIEILEEEIDLVQGTFTNRTSEIFG